MSDWRKVALGEVLNFQRGFDITQTTQKAGSIPVVSSGGISSFNNESAAVGPGVVIGRKGTLGKAFYLPGDYWPHDTTLWVQDFKGNHPRFVYYFMSQFDVSWLDVGSANPTLNRNHLHPVEVTWPPLGDQVAIAEVLGALDDKIAANTRLAHTADELQRTKFHSLLADAIQMPLSDTAQFVNGKAFTKNATGTGRMVVRIAELNSGPGGSTVYNDLDVDDKHLARAGDILFAWSGSLTLHRWYRDEAIVNQHIFKVIPNPEFPSWLVFELIRHKLEEFRAVAADKATTMGHIQRRHLDEPVLVPLRTAIDSCDSLMAGLWDRALKANEENLALASLRDTLIPHLMSGKLRVKDAEIVVEGAL